MPFDCDICEEQFSSLREACSHLKKEHDYKAALKQLSKYRADLLKKLAGLAERQKARELVRKTRRNRYKIPSTERVDLRLRPKNPPSDPISSSTIL